MEGRELWLVLGLFVWYLVNARALFNIFRNMEPGRGKWAHVVLAMCWPIVLPLIGIL